MEAPVSTGQGYDDVVFTGGQAFLSYSNPSIGTDPVLVALNSLTMPFLNVTTIATYAKSPTTLNDPDSLKLDNHGNLVESSGADGALNFFDTTGNFQKAISINQGGTPVTGLDDSFFSTAGSGLVFFTDTATNGVYVVNATNLTADSIYAAVGSQHSIGQVDSVTGNFTSVITDGAANSSPRGLAFVSTPEPTTQFLLLAGFAMIGIPRLVSSLSRK